MTTASRQSIPEGTAGREGLFSEIERRLQSVKVIDFRVRTEVQVLTLNQWRVCSSATDAELALAGN